MLILKTEEIFTILSLCSLVIPPQNGIKGPLNEKKLEKKLLRDHGTCPPGGATNHSFRRSRQLVLVTKVINRMSSVTQQKGRRLKP